MKPKKNLKWRRQTNAEKKAERTAGHKYIHVSVALGYDNVRKTWVLAPPQDRRTYVRART